MTRRSTLSVLVAAALVAMVFAGPDLASSQSDGVEVPTMEQFRALEARVAALEGKSPTTTGPGPTTTARPTTTTVPPAGQVTEVPASIASDCSRPVDVEINAWLADIPNGATARFAPNACYAQDGTFTLTDRADLTVDGQGAEFRAVSFGETFRPNWRLLGGRNLTLRNMVVRGVHPGWDAGRLGREGGHHVQHGYSVESTQGAMLVDVKAFDVDGDFVSVGADRRLHLCQAPPARDVLVERFHGFGNARTTAVTHGERVTIRDSYLADSWDNHIDIETDDDCGIARSIRLHNNRFGRAHFGLISAPSNEPDSRGGDFEVIGNRMEEDALSCIATINLDTPGDTLTRHRAIIRDNDLRAMGDAIWLNGWIDARVENNTLRKDHHSCGVDNTAAVRLTRSQNVNVAANTIDNGTRGFGFGSPLVNEGSTNVTQDPPGTTPDPAPLGPAEPDKVPPTVALVSPVDGATVTGSVSLEATVGGGNVWKAEFHVDGRHIKTDTGPNFSATWNTAAEDVGPHRIEVKGYDYSGNVAAASISVTVRR